VLATCATCEGHFCQICQESLILGDTCPRCQEM
jgi:hypothetical protein